MNQSPLLQFDSLAAQPDISRLMSDFHLQYILICTFLPALRRHWTHENSIMTLIDDLLRISPRGPQSLPLPLDHRIICPSSSLLSCQVILCTSLVVPLAGGE